MLNNELYKFDELITQNVTYSLATLRKFEHRITYFAKKHGVHTFGVIVNLNAIQIDVFTETNRIELLRDLESVGIPRDAIIVRVRPNASVGSTMQHN